jgi:hypothetical protein
MDLKLDNEQLKQVVAGAILSAISNEQREALIAKAVSDLIVATEQDTYYGSRERISPLQRAFRTACESVAVDLCKQEMAKPENIARVQKIVSEGIEAAISKQADAIAVNLGEVIVKALSGQLKERY